MAFMGIFLFFAAVVLIILFLGAALIIIGTILYKKTDHKKLGIALRIFGYVVIVPVIVTAVVFMMIR